MPVKCPPLMKVGGEMSGDIAAAVLGSRSTIPTGMFHLSVSKMVAMKNR